MSTANYITGYSVINSNTVSKNGAKLFAVDVDLPDFLTNAYHHFELNYPKFYKMDNLSKLGWLASEVLLKDSFQKEKYQPEETGVILANANSSLDDDIKYWDSVKTMASPALFVYTLPNIVIGEICIRNHFKGEQALYIQPEFDAGFLAQQVNHLLNHNILQACVCGWVDVFGQDYKAVLFLIEKENKANAMLFSAENADELFKKEA